MKNIPSKLICGILVDLLFEIDNLLNFLISSCFVVCIYLYINRSSGGSSWDLGGSLEFPPPPPLPLCIWETSKRVLLQTVQTQMKCSIMRHFIRVSTVKVTKIFRQKNTIFLENYNLTPLDMYNGLSQMYCIKSLVYKGLRPNYFI